MTGWHLDKRVPIAFIIALAIQTGAIVWWAATLSTRLDAVETWITENKKVTEELAVIKTKQDYIILTIDRIDRKLEAGP